MLVCVWVICMCVRSVCVVCDLHVGRVGEEEGIEDGQIAIKNKAPHTMIQPKIGRWMALERQGAIGKC